MILVQNLLQLLNGSKNIFLLAAISLFVFTSCVTTKGGNSGSGWGKDGNVGVLRPKEEPKQETEKKTDPIITKEDNSKKTVSKEEKNFPRTGEKENNTVAKPDTVFQVIDEVDNGGILHNYNVLVLLPFNVQKNTLDYENNKIDSKSKVALEFYQGMMQSLRELKREGMNFTVRVYDTRIDPYRTKSLLNSLQYEPIDLIIGPVYNKCLIEAAEWARVHKTYLISPIASNADFIQENPYFVAVNPTMDAHTSKLVQYISSEKRVNRVTIITNANDSKDVKLAESFQNQFGGNTGIGDFNTSNSVNIIYETSSFENNWEDYLIRAIDNHVIVASMDEVFASEIVRRLQMMHSKFPIVLYGMPNWARFNNINIDYLENMNLHLTSVSCDDANDMNQQQMISNYKQNVGLLPSEFSKRGYDVANYLFKSMNEYGSELGNSLPRAGMYNGCFMDVFVRPSRSYTGKTRLYENTAVKVLEFEDYEFRLAR